MPLPFNITNPGIFISGLITSEEQAFVTNLVGLTYAEGDILYHNGTDIINLGIGSNGEVLKSNGTTISWGTATASSIEGTAVLSTGELGGAKFLREDGDGTSSWQALAGGGDALVASPLSQFAATTSAQLSGVISDETGSGLLVFGTSPTLVTPVLGTPTSGDMTNVTNLGFSGFDTDVADTMGFVAGAYLDSPSVDVTSDGTTITCTVEKDGGGDLRTHFITGLATIDTTPAVTVSLTAGSDTVPTMNYIYFDEPTKTLTANTTGFPVADIARIAEVLCPSATKIQSEGPYAQRNWTDHLKSATCGHLSHVNVWIRSQAATWISGVATTPTITVNGGAEDNINISTSSGSVLQLHEHSYPAFDTSVSSHIQVINDFTTPYTEITDLNAADTDDAGNAIGHNDYTNLVLWGVVSEDSNDCHILVNLPSGFHSTSLGATIDGEGYSNYTIPSNYKGTGFLIARLTFKYSTSASGTWTLVENKDLRSGGVTGGSGTGTTEFSDNVFRILDNADTSKEIAFQASGITTATTRTVTMPDKDVTLGELEGTEVLSTGEAGGIKYLREDGDGTCSWQTPSGTGDVVGPASATDNAIARFDTTTGKLIQNSVVTIDDSGDTTITSTSNLGLGPTLKLYHDSSTPAVDDEIGIINFNGNNSIASEITYGKINVTVIDETSGSEDSSMGMSVLTNGALQQVFSFQGSTNSVFIGSGSSASLRSNGNYDLILKTGNVTTGSITITDGANGDITLAPDGTGIVKGELKRFMVQLLAEDTDQATATTIGGDFRISNRAITIKDVGAYCDTAGTTGTFTVDINEAGTTILSTKITVDTTEKSSETAATAAVISDSAIAADAIVTFDIDAIQTTAAKGLKVWVDYIYA